MDKPTVFISYSHDSPGHAERVRALGASLARDGCDCRLDVHKDSGEDWPTWMKRQLIEADRVLCVVTETYERRFRDQELPDVGLGVGWEAVLIRRLLYAKKLHNDRIFPVFFEPTDRPHVPLELQGYDAFLLDGQPGYESLLRKVLQRPLHAKPETGTPPDLPIQATAPHFERPGDPAPSESPPGPPAIPDARKSLCPEVVTALDGQIVRIVNPFGEIRAIRDPQRFIGRETELRRLRNLLQGGSVTLGGGPKVGKSSLLWRLAETWQGTLLGHIDLQGIEDRDDFYQSLGEKLGLENGDWRSIRKELKQRSGLLLLDELDYEPEVGLSAADLSRFRAVCESNLSFKILAVSREPLRTIFPQKRGSKGYSFLQPLTLGEMTEPEARQLLTHRWLPEAPPFDADSMTEMLERCGGHPFKLQRAAYHCYEVLAELAPEWQQAWQQDMEHLL